MHWEIWHRTYHDALIRACESPILLQLCHMLHDMNDRYRRIFLSAHEFDRDVASEHRAITEAALARDAQTACALLESHIERTGRNILGRMRKQLCVVVSNSGRWQLVLATHPSDQTGS